MTERILGPTGSPKRRRFLFVPVVVVALLSVFWIAGAQAVHDDGYFELDKDATNDLRTVALDTLASNVNAGATSITVCRKTTGDPPTPIADPGTPFTILIDAEELTVASITEQTRGGGCSTDKDIYNLAAATTAAHAGGSDVTQLIEESLPGADWDQVFAEVTEDTNDEGADDRCADLGADECAFIADPQVPTDTSIFIGGGSKDDLDVPNWKWTSGAVPDADEILNAYAVKYSNGNQILYFGADRYATNGAKDFGFWFFREPVTQIPEGASEGTFAGQHTAPTDGEDGIPGNDDDTPGDILILGTFTQGGATTNIRVFEWVGTGGNATANGTVAGPVGAFGDCVPGSNDDPGCGTVNNTSIPSPWPYQAKGASVGGFIPSGGFVEGGIDLTALNLEGCFASFVAETRTAPSVDAQLKDFVVGNFEECDASVTTTPSDDNGDPVSTIELTDTIRDLAVIQGSGSAADPTGTVDFYLCAPDELDGTGDDDPNTCDVGGTLISTNDVEGDPDVDGRATALSDAATPDSTGTWCWRGEYSGDGNYPAEKDDSEGECFLVVDARIAISPLTATNEVNDTHTLTATVQKDDGTLAAADGVLVTFMLSNNTANAVFTGDPPVSTCTTGADGTCSVSITTSTAGSVDIDASADIGVGGLTLTRATDGTGNNSDNANKVFVDAQISIAPDDTNGIGEAHTFTVSVDQDAGDGNGMVDAPIGNVDVTLTNGGGASYVLDGANSTCDDGQPDGDNLNASGQCTVTFTSNSAGTVTGNATVTLTVGGVTMTRDTDDSTADIPAGPNGSDEAVKTFIAGTLVWNKNDNNNTRLGGATFQVCRTHTLNTAPNPDVMQDTTDVCASIVDDTDGTVGTSNGLSGPDQDGDAGEFKLTDLVLGRYTVQETAAPAGWALDPDLETADDMSLLDPDAAIATTFVDHRPILKITGFGYTNAPTATSPTSGILSGTTTFTVDLRNYGGAEATLTNSSLVASVTGAGSGTLTCNGDGDPPTNSKAITTASPIAAGATAGPFTLTCTYSGMADGAVIKAELNVRYTLNGLERTASGSPAVITFTVQGD